MVTPCHLIARDTKESYAFLMKDDHATQQYPNLESHN